MKKLFQIVGILSLMGISFFYTEKTVSVVKEYDSIMISIREVKNKYKKDYINGIINDNTIIPGISGVEVDVNKSYNKMKKYGSFDESLIVLKKIKPKISITNNNNNKYIISGNKNIRNVSLLFDVSDNIDTLLEILDNKNVKASFILNDNWIVKNTSTIPILVNEKHNIVIKEYNDYDYNKTIIKKISKQKNMYCYTPSKDDRILKICNKEYVLIPNIIIANNPYEKTKHISNGSIITYKLTNELLDELPIIINYIKNKGYNIVTLEELFSE